MSKIKLRYILKEIYSFLTNRKFLLNLLGLILFIAIVIWAVLAWLKVYTNHGQQLEMPDYIGESLVDAELSAEERTFEIIVNDSVYIVDKPGGLIQNQNPAGGSLVKENRKIYVTTTKFIADQVDLSDLSFYGEAFNLMRASLQSKGIRAKIKEFKYDPYTSNTILEVLYGGKTIISKSLNPEDLKLPKGSELEFVVSTQEGGNEVVQNLVGRSVGEAKFMLRRLTLDISYANDLGIEDTDAAIIVSQSPSADGATALPHGSAIQVTVKAPPSN